MHMEELSTKHNHDLSLYMYIVASYLMLPQIFLDDFRAPYFWYNIYINSTMYITCTVYMTNCGAI